MKIRSSIIFSFLFNTMTMVFPMNALSQNAVQVQELAEAEDEGSFDDGSYDEELLNRLKKEAIEAEKQQALQKEDENFKLMQEHLKDPKQLEAFQREFAHYKKDADAWKKRKVSFAAAMIASLTGIATLFLGVIKPHKKVAADYLEKNEDKMKDEILAAETAFETELGKPHGSVLSAFKAVSKSTSRSFEDKKKDAAFMQDALDNGLGESEVKEAYTTHISNTLYQGYLEFLEELRKNPPPSDPA